MIRTIALFGATVLFMVAMLLPTAALAGENKKENKQDSLESRLEALKKEISIMKAARANAWSKKLTIGGYGEMHGTFGLGASPEYFDLHRLVMYLGYDFNSWIKYHMESEVEHAYVTSSAGGEVAIEQAMIDFQLNSVFNVRVGRVLTPLGIINEKHEPPTFYSVERPSFAKYLIPTTWSSDGAGAFGKLSKSFKYQAYIVGGLDGSKFHAIKGLRSGRVKERPGLHEPAVTGRLDYYPLATRAAAYGQTLRLGLSAYGGGINNGNKGSNPDIDGGIRLVSVDFEYRISKFEVKGVAAHGRISGAAALGGGVAEEIFGYYLEAVWHWWPKTLRRRRMPKGKKRPKLEKADAVVFLRFDHIDTQYKMPSGVSEDLAGNRNEVTFGVAFMPTTNVSIKADIQFHTNKADDDIDNTFNLGIGWKF